MAAPPRWGQGRQKRRNGPILQTCQTTWRPESARGCKPLKPLRQVHLRLHDQPSPGVTEWSRNPELRHRRLTWGRLCPKGRGPIQDGQKRAAGKALSRCRWEIWNFALEEGTSSWSRTSLRKRQLHCGLGSLKQSAYEIETLPIERLLQEHSCK
jgi:hypothetical protein